MSPGRGGAALPCLALLFWLSPGCACRPQEPACPPPGLPVDAGPAVEVLKDAPHHLERCQQGDAGSALEAFAGHFAREAYEEALSCAGSASASFPDDAQAHAARGAALAALGRHPEAMAAFARGLAVDPDSVEVLLGAAEYFALSAPPAPDHGALALLYAERGLELTSRGPAVEALPFHRVAARALNALGRAAEALEQARAVLEVEPGDEAMRYERGLALFELCRFDEARPVLEALVRDPDYAAAAHWHLGLLVERQGDEARAASHFEEATRQDPRAYPPGVVLPRAEFEAELAKAVAELPTEVREDLSGVAVQVEDVPALEDLTLNEPPLSPTIVGLFRGPPLGEPCLPQDGEPCRSIVLYRKNLGRTVASRAELDQQLRVTLLHEVGHLRGEDDDHLAARGLE